MNQLPGNGEKINTESNQIDEKFQKVDVETNKKARKRKQESPKKCNDFNTKRREENKVGAERRVQKKKINKDKTANQPIESSKAQNNASKISTKADLEFLSLDESEDLSPIFKKFQKILGVFQDPQALKIIRFLLYLVVKEKRSCQKRKHHPCHSCGSLNV